MNINSNFIKLSGKAEIPEPLELGKNYKIEIDATVTSITDHDNNDGTFDRAYKVEPILAKITKDNGEVIKARDTRKESQKLRSRLYMFWQNNNDTTPFEDFYSKILMKIRLNIEEIISTYE